MLSAKPRNAFPTCSTPQYVGGYTVGFTGTASETSVSLTSLTGGLASAPAENDIVIVVYGTSGGSTDKDLYATGYTEMCDLVVSAGNYLQFGVFWKKMTATPDTSVTVSQTANTASAGAVAVHVWRGQDLTTPFCATPTTFTESVIGTAINPSAITSPYAGAIIICAAASSGDGTFGYTASYLSNFITQLGNDTADVLTCVGSVVALGGSYDPAAWTKSGVSVYRSAGVTMVLKGA